MTDVVINNGFSYIGVCNCSGKPKKYRKGNYMIKIYTGKKRWELYKNGHGIIQGREDQLVDGLQKYIANV